ncbi:MAG TPA: hypothetical protein PL001_08875, partial [Candidatus Kryptobacter bacterium]|nr:hypothetical protein [Candidatus Kryptobacter bacterium]
SYSSNLRTDIITYCAMATNVSPDKVVARPFSCYVRAMKRSLIACPDMLLIGKRLCPASYAPRNS